MRNRHSTPKGTVTEMTRLFGASGFAVLLCATPLLAQTHELSRKGDAVLPISPALCNHMKLHHVLNPGTPVGCDRLRLLKFGYIDFGGQTHSDGEMVVLDAVADHVLQIFGAPRGRRFPIASVKLMDHYDGDDDASTAQNNTSAFNVRRVAGGSAMSLHAYGVAIDLNPEQNPYIIRSGRTVRIDSRSGADYVSRKTLRPGMAEPVVDLFARHGFVEWGGYWRNPIDYQHFQVGRKLAYQLARLPAMEARALFERFVENLKTGLGKSREGARSRAD
jgi:hypothetical protein